MMNSNVGQPLEAVNPLIAPWATPFGIPPFASIKPEHFEPAFDAAMKAHRAELDALAHASEAPSFDNTLRAFDVAGRLLSRVSAVFYNLAASNTNQTLQAVERAMASKLAAHHSAIHMHAALFARVHALHEQRQSLALDPESLRLLEKVHRAFVRAGAQLAPESQARLAQIQAALATLTTQFGQNVLAAENEGWVALGLPEDLDGLPPFVVDAARQAAIERGQPGHVITLGRSMVVPFLTFSRRRDWRERVWRAWTMRGERPGPHDNRALVLEILRLRAEQAALLGHASYAAYATDDKMARTPSAVMRLLDDVWARALPAFERERAQVEAAMQSVNCQDDLAPWDWRHWAEQHRRKAFAIEDAEVKPYFSLERMVTAAFDCAKRLFGIEFVEQADWPVYHPDVRAYLVQDATTQAAVGVFLHDNFSRSAKRSGAWMSSFRRQSRTQGEVLPIIVNNCNFNKAPDGEATLLGFDDVRTLFHEFGHALHGLLSNVTYDHLSGTQVLRDFVELPSQLFEHWMMEPSVLREHARHAQTQAPIPEALIDKLKRASQSGQGYETLRYVASALIDMDAHGRPLGSLPTDVVAMEQQCLQARGWPAVVGMNHRFTHFQHLFSGDGYAAGYFVYLWAEVLDEDAFTAFEEAGDPFSPSVSARLKAHIYAAGDSVDPEATYERFRGRAPSLQPMLRARGLLDQPLG